MSDEPALPPPPPRATASTSGLSRRPNHIGNISLGVVIVGLVIWIVLIGPSFLAPFIVAVGLAGSIVGWVTAGRDRSRVTAVFGVVIGAIAMAFVVFALIASAARS